VKRATNGQSPAPKVADTHSKKGQSPWAV
jgi:hypothetical protein